MRRTIYRSTNLHVFSNQDVTAPENGIVVGFQNWRPTQGLDDPGFGETFLDKNRLAGVFVNCIGNSWWQYDDLPEALAAVASATAPFEQRITYGSSMGGYAALRFADLIGATLVIAASPQFSPRHEVVPVETRYTKAICGVNFKYEDGLLPFKHITRYLLYDPLLKVDREQVQRYAAFGSVHLVPMPASGHPCLSLLLDQERLSSTVKLMMSGHFNIAEFRTEQRHLRRATFRYWEQLSFRFAERQRFVLASRIAEKAAEHFLDHRDRALSLALRWTLYAGDHVRAGMITTRISAGYPDAVRLWTEAFEHRRRVLARQSGTT